MKLIPYRGKQYDADKLAVVAKQGVPITVPLDKIDQVANVPSSTVIVVVNNDRYDMLGGTLHIDRKTEKVAAVQKVNLLSKMVLKKALPQESVAVDATQRTSYERPDRPRYDRNQRYYQD